jgi:ATP synthase protein I
MSLTPDELGQKIKEAQSRQSPETEVKKPASPANSRALRAGTDFVAALVVGVFLGYWIDRWLHTTPIGIIICLFLGFGAGIMNLYRSQTGHDK